VAPSPRKESRRCAAGAGDGPIGPLQQCRAQRCDRQPQEQAAAEPGVAVRVRVAVGIKARARVRALAEVRARLEIN